MLPGCLEREHWLEGMVCVCGGGGGGGGGDTLHQLGTMAVEVTGNAARLPGKETLLTPKVFSASEIPLFLVTSSY